MRAGKLNRRITIQSISESRDAYGEPIKSWVTAYTVWAEVRPLRGDERAQNQQLVSKADTKFIIRYNSSMTITEQHRIQYDSDNYDITAILEIGHKKGWEILGHKID